MRAGELLVAIAQCCRVQDRHVAGLDRGDLAVDGVAPLVQLSQPCLRIGLGAADDQDRSLDSNLRQVDIIAAVRQLITRVDEGLADAIKQHAALAGESVNAYVTRVLEAAVAGRRAWKREALAHGRLEARKSARGPRPRVTTPAGYGSELVSADRTDR